MRLLSKILQTQGHVSASMKYLIFFTGILFLLSSIQLFMNAWSLFQNRTSKKDSFQYVVINKVVSNEMMGDSEKSSFTTLDLEQLKSIPGVEEIAPIVPSNFGITANGFGELAFSTQLFFEAVPDSFLDIQPDNWHWQEGKKTIPVILSADFLNLYNFGFALSQGLPQFSEESIQKLSFQANIIGSDKEENVQLQVVGFSKRYSSILVPMNFMQYANKTFGFDSERLSSRVIIQSKEPDHPKLVKFLADHHYARSATIIQQTRLKSILFLIFGLCCALALFILILSLSIIHLKLALDILQSAEKLKLLSLLGYETNMLIRQFIALPIKTFMLLTVIACILIALGQAGLSNYLAYFNLILTKWPSIFTLLAACFLCICVYYLMHKKAKESIRQYL